MLKLVDRSFRGKMKNTYIYIVLNYLSQNTNYKRIKVGKPSRYYLQQVIQVDIICNETNRYHFPLDIVTDQGP